MNSDHLPARKSSKSLMQNSKSSLPGLIVLYNFLATNWWLRHDHTLPLSAKGVACEIRVIYTAFNAVYTIRLQLLKVSYSNRAHTYIPLYKVELITAPVTANPAPIPISRFSNAAISLRPRVALRMRNMMTFNLITNLSKIGCMWLPVAVN